ncbi:hypothetical protein VTO42DRAFT_1689 [Malbranchea cinnamomea]
MRTRLLPTSLLLLLLSTAPTTFARDLFRPATIPKPHALESSSILQPRGLQDIPVDGNDGRPHTGPFVETSAERDRKKAQGTSRDVDLPKSDDLSKHIGPDGKLIPTSNDGVMDDKNRLGPKEGTRGTEGGISEKTRSRQLGEEKTPDPPKEAPPLPHSEQQKIAGGVSEANEEEPKLLEKPDDLPESPYSAPASKPDELDDLSFETLPSWSLDAGRRDVKGNEIIQPFHSFVLSLTMIVFSEIGDKTFLVAALMAMRHPRMVVFSAAFTALIAMTVLSAVLGHAVPALIPVSYTSFLAGILFLVFGVKMLLEAKAMSPDESVSEEMKEVEMELEEKEQQQFRMGRRRSSVTPHALEAGRNFGTRKSRSSSHRLPSPDSISSSSSRESSPSGRTVTNLLTGLNNLFSLLLSPAWVQTFVMTFLGEWGDRSQIATFAMATGQDYWWVVCGAISGHGLCTAAAVLGGRAVAGRVSMRVVTFGGAIAFFVFGALYLIEAIY